MKKALGESPYLRADNLNSEKPQQVGPQYRFLIYHIDVIYLWSISYMLPCSDE